MTYYEILGVAESAPVEIIAAAHRTLAKIYHPENGTAPNPKKIREVTEAYATLKDPEKRRLYDTSLLRAQPKPANNGKKPKASKRTAQVSYPPAYPGMNGEKIQASIDEMMGKVGATVVQHVVQSMPTSFQDLLREALKGGRT